VAYPVLVKAREGRPIHVEGNAEHPLYQGKTSFHAPRTCLASTIPTACAPRLSTAGRPPGSSDAAARPRASGCGKAGQGHRPWSRRGAFADAPGIDRTLGRGLAVCASHPMGARGRPSRPPGPTRTARRNKTSPVSFSTGRKPSSHWTPTFSGTLGDAVFRDCGFSSMRRPAYFVGPMNRLYVFEGGMSLTGSRADVRIAIRPSAFGPHRLRFGACGSPARRAWPCPRAWRPPP